MRLFYFFLAASIAMFTGCVNNQPKVIETKASQVELRAMQSKDVELSDMNKLSRIVLQLLQDDGYEIENVDSNAGYFKAVKKMDGGKEEYKFAIYDIYYPIAIYKYLTLNQYIKEISGTISIRTYENKATIRASFFADIKKEDGKLFSRAIIEDPKFYQEFYAKLDKAIFLEKNDL